MYWPSSTDPYNVANPAQNSVRQNYYGVNATPTLKVDGVLDIWPISVQSVTDAINQRHVIPSHIWMDLTPIVIGNVLSVQVKAVADQNITGNKVLQIQLLEHYHYYPAAPNGNANFYDAMLRIAPNANGQEFLAMAGDTFTYGAAFTLNPAWAVNNADVVCFVQDNDTREVLQSHMEPATVQPAQNVDIVLTPVSPPIQIPAQGGSFNFNINLVNHLDSLAHFHTWIMQRNPAGLWEGPMFGPIWLGLPASANITRMRSQNVPGTAAPGTYTYRGYVGMYNSDSRWDSSSFTYVKLTAGNGPLVPNWENYGESFDQVETMGFAGAIPSEYVTVSATPNPFNPTTAISYTLQAASQVSLKVFDTSGRLVTTLVEGMRDAGSHEVTFDGTTLASGMYLYTLTAGQHTASGKMVLLK
jgi:hypothetical protein